MTRAVVRAMARSSASRRNSAVMEKLVLTSRSRFGNDVRHNLNRESIIMAMEKQAFALEEEVRQLREQEQRKHTALLKQRLYSCVVQFLMGSLDMRHWWFGYSTLIVFMMRVLELYPTTERVCVFYKMMIQQLRTVDIYHASMESVHIELEFEFTPDSIKFFFIKLQGMDAHRIQRQLEETSMGASSENLVLTLYEILTQRRLLSDFRIIRVLSKWTSSQFSDVNTNPSLESLRGCADTHTHISLFINGIARFCCEVMTFFSINSLANATFALLY
ncbi:hypothetical protein PsorP6_015317 [Peronosclerospora sorghi]|uniref:Uncharacterized protein n=1 Tax=Peronosclerospora sorghi TaxID=230839 RepID=A0ACC0VU12_9STRA|nr:hypothetical protein PsorP6_015317 [Peronosclerospora sorghi]